MSYFIAKFIFYGGFYAIVDIDSICVEFMYSFGIIAYFVEKNSQHGYGAENICFGT